MNDKELKALISLLDDPDMEVINEVTNNLTKKGLEVIPELEKVWETTYNEILQERLENIIKNIQLFIARKNMENWIKTGAENILEGAFYVAQFQFPDISFQSLNDEIEKIYKDVWLEYHNNLTALEKINILNFILFDTYKYSKKTTNFNSPQHSHINQVIRTKKGSPVSLAIIYLSLAEKLDLPVYGIDYEDTFILAYRDEQDMFDRYTEPGNILFYINPYDKGAILDKREIDYFISNRRHSGKETNSIKCSNIDIIILLINELIASYEMSGSNEAAARYLELLRTIEQF